MAWRWKESLPLTSRSLANSQEASQHCSDESRYQAQLRPLYTSWVGCVTSRRRDGRQYWLMVQLRSGAVSINVSAHEYPELDVCPPSRIGARLRVVALEPLRAVHA